MRTLAPLLFASLLCTAPTVAQTPGNCEHGTAQADLDVSDVRARLFNNGNLFYGNTTTSGNGYAVPKLSGANAIYAANLWVGGTVNDELRAAAATFLNFEMWPGPLQEGATLPNPDDCSAYDRIWLVSALDVATYDETGNATADLAEWPVELGAEVIDGDGIEGNYDLKGGDRPRVYGSQTAFWVMNDVGNTHDYTGSDPLGVELQVSAFSISSPEPALDRSTFYRIRIVNRNTLPIEEARFSIFADTDLGDTGNEREGVDTLRALGYYYNRDETDSSYGVPPAAGFDFLNAELSSFRYAINSGGDVPVADPAGLEAVANTQRGLWNDGTPQTAAGSGYITDGPVTVWAFPADPVTAQCWSGENDCLGGATSGGNNRIIPNSAPFTLNPGEAKTFDVAFLFAQGEDRLDSITELRAASDLVQSAYEDGDLFQTVLTASTLAAPVLAAPEEGAVFVTDPPTLSWEPVSGAAGYTVRWGTDPDFEQASGASTTETEYVPNADFPENEIVDVYWQVRAEAPGDIGPYSATRSFQYYLYEEDEFGGGIGVVETAYPGVDDVCADAPLDPGCAEYDGNTVFDDPNSTGDYLLSGGTEFALPFQTDVIRGDDFEMRFTETCAAFGTCLGAYLRDSGEIASVPFELWNIRDEDDPSDDVRMIPILRTPHNDGAALPVTNWNDTFTATRTVEVDGDEQDLPVAERLFWSMPDRPDGYALFEAAANGFGGPGALYDRTNDGDDQVDLNASGSECAQQGGYIDFCYRSLAPYRAPIGGASSAGLLVADLAGDGTTPPTGTTIRFVSVDILLVDTEEGGVAQPSAFAITAAYPNPFGPAVGAQATVEYALERAADVDLAAYDLLGRRVAVLAEGRRAAGAHRASLSGAGLASGVYVVVLEAGGERRSRKLLLVR